jgi:hypothetical protein
VKAKRFPSFKKKWWWHISIQLKVHQLFYAFDILHFWKLSKKISNIFGHDVKFCGQNILSSWCSIWIWTNFTSICIIQNAPKMHVNCIFFYVSWVTLINTLTSLRYYSFMSIKVWWQCSMSSMEFKCSFFNSNCFFFFFFFLNFILISYFLGKIVF